MLLNITKALIKNLGNSVFFTTYFILWVLATYVMFKLYIKQIVDVDFRIWEDDVLIASCTAYVILCFKLYLIVIKKRHFYAE